MVFPKQNSPPRNYNSAPLKGSQLTCRKSNFWVFTCECVTFVPLTTLAHHWSRCAQQIKHLSLMRCSNCSTHIPSEHPTGITFSGVAPIFFHCFFTLPCPNWSLQPLIFPVPCPLLSHDFPLTLVQRRGTGTWTEQLRTAYNCSKKVIILYRFIYSYSRVFNMP